MLFAIASAGSEMSSSLDPRFGRAAGFAIIDSDSLKIIDYIVNPNIAAGGGAGISTAQMLANRGVRAVIAGAVGPNAFGVLSSANIAMYSTAGLSNLQDAIDAFKSGKLEAIQSPGATGHPGGGMGAGSGMGRF